MHRSKQLKLFDHFVGAGDQKMRDYDLAELAGVTGVISRKQFAHEQQRSPQSLLPCVNATATRRRRLQFGWLDEFRVRNGNCEQRSFE